MKQKNHLHFLMSFSLATLFLSSCALNDHSAARSSASVGQTELEKTEFSIHPALKENCSEGILKTNLCPETDGKDFYDKVPEHPIVNLNGKNYLNVSELQHLSERAQKPRNAIEAEAVKHVQDWVWRFLVSQLSKKELGGEIVIRNLANIQKVSFIALTKMAVAQGEKAYLVATPYGFNYRVRLTDHVLPTGAIVILPPLGNKKSYPQFVKANVIVKGEKSILEVPSEVFSKTLDDSIVTDKTHKDALELVFKEKNNNEPVRFEEFKSIVEQYGKSEIVNGNSIKYLFSGVENYTEKVKLIESAQKTIHIVAFSFGQDVINKDVLDLLSKKADQGVQIKMIFDYAAVASYFAVNFVKKYAKKNLEVVFYNPMVSKSLASPFDLKNHRLHEKYMIVDGRSVILGGYNWGSKYSFGGNPYFPSGWRDTDIRIEGPLVGKIQERFLRDWVLYNKESLDYVKRDNTPAPFNKDAPVARFDWEKSLYYSDYTLLVSPEKEKYFNFLRDEEANVPAIFISQKPFEERNLHITDSVIKLIDSAKKTIYWGCHGIRPQKPVMDALLRAVKRGVQVVLVTNSQHSAKTLMLSGVFGKFYKMCDIFYSELLKGGVRIFEWFNRGAFHSKMLVVDGVITSVGSYNLALGSLQRHTETTVMFYDEKLAVKAEKQFKKDLAQAYEVVLDREVEMANERLGEEIDDGDILE